MDSNEFPSNANTKPASASTEKKVEKVTTGTVGRRKTPLGKKFLETFIVGNTQSVAQYVVSDVIIPTLKDVITEIIQTTVERMLFGDRARPGRRPGTMGQSHTPYNRYAQSSSPNTWQSRGRPGVTTRTVTPTSGYEEIILATLPEANEVIDQMFTLCEKFNQVTLRDLHDLVGVESNFAQDRWGWTDIRGLRATRIREGYLIDLPKPIALD
jgi:hypothetical protein